MNMADVFIGFIFGAILEAVASYFMRKYRINRLIHKDIAFLEAKAKALRKLIPVLLILSLASCHTTKRTTTTQIDQQHTKIEHDSVSRQDSLNLSRVLSVAGIDIDLVFSNDSAHRITGGGAYENTNEVHPQPYVYPASQPSTPRSTIGSLMRLGGNLQSVHIHVDKVTDSSHYASSATMHELSSVMDTTRTQTTQKVVEVKKSIMQGPAFILTIFLIVLIIIVILYYHFKKKLL